MTSELCQKCGQFVDMLLHTEEQCDRFKLYKMCAPEVTTSTPVSPTVFPRWLDGSGPERIEVLQEQIILDLLCALREAKLIWVQRYGSYMFECLFCDGERSVFRDYFKHEPDCPVELARRLHEARNR